MLREQVDAIGVGIGKGGAYGGGGVTVLSALTLHEWGIVVGIAIGVLGYFTQVFFNVRREKRETEFHTARMFGLTSYKKDGDADEQR